MTGKEIFEIWASRQSVWSHWASPVAFTNISCDDVGVGAASASQEALEISRVLGTAYVIDLPGASAVRAAMNLARTGLRPVPIFNAAPVPKAVVPGEIQREALVDGKYLARELCFAAAELPSLLIGDSAAPVFVLDANRVLANRTAGSPRFDNRWIVYPQDFPSGPNLREHGITRVLVVQQQELIADDLNDVLVEWQNAGLEIFTRRNDERAVEVRRHVKPPSPLRLLWSKFLRLLGFKTSGDLWDRLTSGSSGG